MVIPEKIRHIGVELRGHAPFTLLGALAGLIFMLIFNNLGKPGAGTLFSIFHPAHVVLSSMVTASMFEMHKKAKNFILILGIGYVGSIGVATLSDSIVPYFGEKILGLNVPLHDEIFHPAEDDHEDHSEIEEGREDEHKIHLGFIEDWYIVNPAAILGVLIAYFLPRTKSPHAVHVLISTWASSSHILMNTQSDLTFGIIVGIFGVLFIAVWLPCCISDIVFPILCVGEGRVPSCCSFHKNKKSHELQGDSQ